MRVIHQTASDLPQYIGLVGLPNSKLLLQVAPQPGGDWIQRERLQAGDDALGVEDRPDLAGVDTLVGEERKAGR